MNRRFVARPVPEHDKLWFLVIGGPDIDIQHTLTDPEHLLEHMRRQEGYYVFLSLARYSF